MPPQVPSGVAVAGAGERVVRKGSTNPVRHGSRTKAMTGGAAELQESLHVSMQLDSARTGYVADDGAVGVMHDLVASQRAGAASTMVGNR